MSPFFFTRNNAGRYLLGYSEKLKFWSWTLVTQGIFVMTLLDNLSQKFAPKKHIFPSLIANSFYKGICSKIQRKNCFFSFFGFSYKNSFWWMILKFLAQFVWSIRFFWYPYWHTSWHFMPFGICHKMSLNGKIWHFMTYLIWHKMSWNMAIWVSKEPYRPGKLS